jgi:DNA-directed RNA polymerase subunit RPC12/RpoP
MNLQTSYPIPVDSPTIKVYDCPSCGDEVTFVTSDEGNCRRCSFDFFKPINSLDYSPGRFDRMKGD